MVSRMYEKVLRAYSANMMRLGIICEQYLACPVAFSKISDMILAQNVPEIILSKRSF